MRLRGHRQRRPNQYPSAMDGRGRIELESISCRGVKAFFNLFQKPSAYAVVSIASAAVDGRQKRNLQSQKTSADHKGGENPEWDQIIRFALDEGDFPDLYLEFSIKTQGSFPLLGSRVIGKSRVRITDLSDGYSSDEVRRASYQIRCPESKPNGILTFSYKMNLPGIESRAAPIPPKINLPSLDQRHPSPPAPKLDSGYHSLPPLHQELSPPLPFVQEFPSAPTSDLGFSHSQPFDRGFPPAPPFVQAFPPGPLPDMGFSPSQPFDREIPPAPPPDMGFSPSQPFDREIPPAPQPNLGFSSSQQFDRGFPPAPPFAQSFPPAPPPDLGFSPSQPFDWGFPYPPPPFARAFPPVPPLDLRFSPSQPFDRGFSPAQSFDLGIPPAPPLDRGIPSAPPIDNYGSWPALRVSIYPPLPMAGAEPEDCFCYPPPSAWNGRGLSRHASFSGPEFSNGSGYTQPAATAPSPAFGTTTCPPSTSCGYLYPPPQGSCDYCN